MHNSSTRGVGRVWVAWDPLWADVTCLKKSVQTITCRVKMHDCPMEFVATCVYGFNDSVLGYDLWEDLKGAATLAKDQAWVIMGDFNVVRAPFERIDGREPDLAEMRDFNDCLKAIEVFEMNTKGFQYTWVNKRG